MAGGVNVGAIYTEDLLMLVPSDYMLNGIRHDLLCTYPDLRRIVTRICV